MAIPAIREDAIREGLVRSSAAPLRLVPTPSGGPTDDPRVPTRRLAQVIAEVLAGARPAAQLSDIVAPEVIRLLVRYAGRLSDRPGETPQRPIVDSVHVREPCPGVAEACAVINLGVRYRAIALRLEETNGQWRCTALRVG